MNGGKRAALSAKPCELSLAQRYLIAGGRYHRLPLTFNLSFGIDVSRETSEC